MLIEATSQTVAGIVYVLTGNDDLNVGSGVTLISLDEGEKLAGQLGGPFDGFGDRVEVAALAFLR